MFFTVATVGETFKDYHFKLGVFHIIRFFFAHSKQSEKYDGTIDETSPISRVSLVTFYVVFASNLFYSVYDIQNYTELVHGLALVAVRFFVGYALLLSSFASSEPRCPSILNARFAE